MRILIVEDHEILRRALSRSLRVRGRVDEADRLYTALDAVGRTRYDVVITDEQLPDGSGCTLLERVKRTQTRCRRVLISATNLRSTNEPSPAYERFFQKPDALISLIYWLDGVRLELEQSSCKP